jgi:plasmid stabilization system protein ParE
VKRVRYDPDAEAEYLGAVEWYAARNAVVAHRFIDAVLETEDMIRENPRQWPNVDDVPHELDVRRCLVKDFPFALVYVELVDEILILAVAHGKRRPGYWQERMPRPPQ